MQGPVTQKRRKSCLVILIAEMNGRRSISTIGTRLSHARDLIPIMTHASITTSLIPAAKWLRRDETEVPKPVTDSAISATSGLLAANDHASLVHPVANTAPRLGHVRLIIGAPGSGKTTLAMQTAVHRIENGQQPDDVLVMTASRAASARLRHALSDHLQRTSSSPLVRSVASTAFAIVRAHAVANQEPPPVLVSGPEQDAVLVELIEGHLAGEGVQPQWPDTIPEESLPLKGFRAELRDLLMRAAEHGLSPSQLKKLGKTYAMPA